MLLTHKIIQLSCDQLVHGGGSQKLLQPVHHAVILVAVLPRGSDEPVQLGFHYGKLARFP